MHSQISEVTQYCRSELQMSSENVNSMDARRSGVMSWITVTTLSAVTT